MIVSMSVVEVFKYEDQDQGLETDIKYLRLSSSLFAYLVFRIYKEDFCILGVP
jgi:hypothetical protein